MIQSLHNVRGRVVPTPSGSEVSRSHQHVGEKGPAESFHQILEESLSHSGDLKFSVHAQERMRLRHIHMGIQDVERLRKGVNQIAEKGGRESLVLLDNSAFLVSVKNRTVITAISGDQMRNNAFTNIDSTIIV